MVVMVKQVGLPVSGCSRVGLDGIDVIAGGLVCTVGDGAWRFAEEICAEEIFAERVSAQERSPERESAEGRSAERGCGRRTSSEQELAGPRTVCSTAGRLGHATVVVDGALDQCCPVG
jgi:hypothetical protein